MQRDEDFTGYMSSRWSTLVRSAVLLGCSQYDAEDVVQTALARCYAAWPKVSRANNRDAYVYRMLVNTLTDSRRRRWWGERPTADALGLAPGTVKSRTSRALAALADNQHLADTPDGKVP